MNTLNVGWWNSTKLHIFKISNLKENDMVVSAKLKIIDSLQINDVEKFGENIVTFSFFFTTVRNLICILSGWQFYSHLSVFD